MNILVIAHQPLYKTKNFSPRGGEISTREIVDFLANKNNITVIQFDKKTEKLKKNNVKFITYSEQRVSKKIEKVEKYVLKQKPDIVLTWSHEGKIANYIKKKYQIPYVLFVRRFQTIINGNLKLMIRFHRTLPSLKNSPYLQGFNSIKILPRVILTKLEDFLYYKTSIYKAFHDSDLVIANSVYTSKVIKKVVNVESIVSLPFVDIKKYKTNTSRKYITTIGKGRKSGQELIEKLAVNMPNEYFFSIGHKKSSKLKNLKTRKEYFSDPKDIYKEVKILLTPRTVPEPFGRIPLEAASSGIPIIGSDIGAHKESIGKGGILINPNSKLEKWLNAINEVNNNYEYYSKEALKHAKKYNGKKQLKIIEKEIEKILK